MQSAPIPASRGAKSIDTFCRDWDLRRSKVYLLIKEGQLRAVKVGRRTVILSADENAFAASLPALGRAA